MRIILLLLLCAVMMLAVAAFHPIDHDEGQYVGAVAMMRLGLPYRDFAYLQTPLQPLLLAPLAWIAEGWLFPALRAVNALLVVAATACIWLAARRAGASLHAAAIAAGTLLFSHMLLFAGSVARNDALPLVLMTAGMAAMMALIQKDRTRWTALVAGLLLGAAASAKISYGLPAAAAGLFALLHWRMLGVEKVALLALGGILGGLPTIGVAILAPETAWFGIIEYSLKAPFEWRTWTGQTSMLEVPLSLVRLARYLAQGCGLIALVAVALVATRRRTPVERLLDMMIMAGLIAAWLPRPIYVQYLGPLLPPLLLRFALLTDAPFWQRRAGRALIAVGLVAGITQSAIEAGRNMLAGHSPVHMVMRDADAMDRIAASAKLSGAIVTLSPERVVDVALPLDRRFVTGPFLLRTRHILTPEQARAFHASTSQTLAADLSEAPPAAILTGSEGRPKAAFPRGLDGLLIAWARSNGYRPVSLPSGRHTLFLAPPSSTQRGEKRS
ncbi:hypothetical protein [Sphingobium sp. MK2]|uniref:hypothetical protein n=1 Tax=Sphingobium sp. MK2 TaxID=3116540 RepID=UPI0032E35DFE